MPASRNNLVSVIIPCYNQGRFLGEAIESVLRQTSAEFEILVVDDGSTDDTAAVAASYPQVRLIRQKNKGLGAARNRGVAESRGNYLVFLDADDLLLPTALESGLRSLKTHPEAAFAYGWYLNVAADGMPLSPPVMACIDGTPYASLLQTNGIGMHAAVMYRREIFAEVGRFDEQLKACEDYDLYLRITRKFPITCSAEVVAAYRQHGANMSHDQAVMLKSALDVLNRQLKYVKDGKGYEEPFNIGVGFWQDYYGEKLIDQIILQIKRREQLVKILRGLLVLLGYYPQGLMRRIWRKAYQAKISYSFIVGYGVWL